jgi:Tfp pilus assembly protein PilN
MRAVNLLPAELRRGGGGAAGRSQGAAHLLLAGLAGLLIMGVLFANAHHQRTSLESQLAPVAQEADAAQARATALTPFTQFDALRAQRGQSISALVTQRVDWAADLRGIASVLPNDVKLLSLTGALPASGAATSSGPAAAAINPATGRPATAGSAAAAAAAAPPPSGPTVQLTGCASTHTQVGDVINLLRGVPGVVAVGLSSSSKAASTPASTTSTPGGCGNPAQHPQFAMTLSFAAPGAASTGAPAPGGTGVTPVAQGAGR